MKAQLLLVKQLFLEAENFVDRGDPVSAGLAISLFQDAIELFVWTLIKERNVAVKDQSGFIANLEAVNKAGFTVPFTARLLELNRARVNFKHYGNLPAESEARKHRSYVEDCLKDAMVTHFNILFDELSLLDLINNTTIRTHLSKAQEDIKAGDLKTAAAEIAKARHYTIESLRRHSPRIDRRLADADRLLSQLSGGRNINVFEYLSDYLVQLQDSALITSLQLAPEDFALIQRGLPHVSLTYAGTWQVVHSRFNYTENECNRTISCLINLCLRLQARP
jgi:hypothetical protein